MFKSKKKIIIFIVIFVIVLGLVSFLSVQLLTPKFKTSNFNGVVSKVYNDDLEFNDVCYGNAFSCKNVKPEIIGDYDLNNVGVYEVEYVFEYKGHTFKKNGVLNVVDNEMPVITKSDEDIHVCPNNGKILEGNITASDSYDGDISDKLSFNYDKSTNKLFVSVSDSSGNKKDEFYDVVASDQVPPVITINGDSTINIKNGSEYSDLGASAIDNCDGEVEVSVHNPVNTKKNGTYEVIYTAKDSFDNVSEVRRTVKVYSPSTSSSGNSYSCEGKIKYSCGGSGKVIYLTFDDGPSGYTNKLLDVLKQYNVKATFFVTGNGSDAAIKREYDEGHTVALHSYTHNYGQIYASMDAYFADLNRINDRVERITGHRSNIVRFPGGSSNTVSRKSKCIMTALAHELANRGYVYYDWNVSSGDAGGTTSTDQVYLNVVNRLGNGKYVVLQHDSKGYSVNAVERIIQYGLSNGYTFERLESNSMTCHHGTAN